MAELSDSKNTSEHFRKHRPSRSTERKPSIRIFDGPARKMFGGTKAVQKKNENEQKTNEQTFIFRFKLKWTNNSKWKG